MNRRTFLKIHFFFLLINNIIFSNNCYGWVITSIDNQSDSPVTINILIKKEAEEYITLFEKDIIIDAYKKKLCDDPIIFPDHPHYKAFSSIVLDPNIQQALKIKTKKASYYCVEGSFFHNQKTLFGSWIQQVSPFHEKECKIRRKKEPAPIFLLGHYGAHDSCCLIIDSKGFISISSRNKQKGRITEITFDKNLNSSI